MSPSSDPSSADAPADPSDLLAGPSVPPRARRLAYGGLVPFVLGAVLVWLVRDEVRPYVTLALSTYAGLIVALLGGVHWGLAMRAPRSDPRRLGWGVLAAAAAWVGVMMPPDAGLVVDGVLLIACYLVDRKVYPAHGISRWLTLRFRLSAVAAASCFLAAAGA